MMGDYSMGISRIRMRMVFYFCDCVGDGWMVFESVVMFCFGDVIMGLCGFGV